MSAPWDVVVTTVDETDPDGVPSSASSKLLFSGYSVIASVGSGRFGSIMMCRRTPSSSSSSSSPDGTAPPQNFAVKVVNKRRAGSERSCAIFVAPAADEDDLPPLPSSSYVATAANVFSDPNSDISSTWLRDDPNAPSNWYKEVSNHRSLDHPQIVLLYEVISSPHPAADVYLVMEYAPNGTLASLLSLPTPRLHAVLLYNVLPGLLSALSYLRSSHRISHRDIKPSNILLSSSWVPRLSDFGSSHRMPPDSSTVSDVVGTLAFLAPEAVSRARGGAPYDPYAADLYALGLTVLAVLCGEEAPPFLVVETPLTNPGRKDEEWRAPESMEEVLDAIQEFNVDVAPTLKDAKIFVKLAEVWGAAAKGINPPSELPPQQQLPPPSLHYWCPFLSSLVSPLPTRCTSISTLESSLLPLILLGPSPRAAVTSMFNASVVIVTFDADALPTPEESNAAKKFIKTLERRGTLVYTRNADSPDAGPAHSSAGVGLGVDVSSSSSNSVVEAARRASGAGSTVVVLSRPLMPTLSCVVPPELGTPDAVLQYIPDDDFIANDDSPQPSSPPPSDCVFRSFSSLTFAFASLLPPPVSFRSLVSVRQDHAMVDGIGGVVWDGAHALLSFLADHVQMEDKTVLELGAGCGIAGIACHRLGAARVIITDGEVDLITENVEAYVEEHQHEKTFDAKAIEIRQIRWNAGEPFEERLDYVIGSELTPMRSQHANLAGEFFRLLALSGGGVGILELDIDAENSEAKIPFVDVTNDFEAKLHDTKGHHKLLSGGAVGFLIEALKLGLKWKLVSIQEVQLDGGGIQGREGQKSYFGIIYLAIVSAPLAAAAAPPALRPPPPCSSLPRQPQQIFGHPPATQAFAKFLVEDFFPLLPGAVEKMIDVGGAPATLAKELKALKCEDVKVTVVVDPRPCSALVSPDVHLPVFFSPNLLDWSRDSAHKFSYSDALRFGRDSLSLDLKGGRLRPTIAVESDEVAPWKARVDEKSEQQHGGSSCECGCHADSTQDNEWGFFALHGAGVIVGVHPDNAAGLIVECGLKHGLPFAVVPCCVLESENTARKNLSGPRIGETVKTYDEMIAWMVDLGKECGEEVFVRRLEEVKGGKNLAVCFLGRRGFAKGIAKTDDCDPFWDVALSPTAGAGLALRNLVPDFEDFKAQQEEERRKSALRGDRSSSDDDEDDDGFPKGGSSSARKSSRKTFKTFNIYNGTVTVDLHQLQEDGVLSTIGGEVWEAAYLLSNYLCLHKEVVLSCEKIIELGAGLGLVGLVCANLFDSRQKKGSVCLSDFSTDLVRNLKRNIRRNTSATGTSDITVRKVDWFDYQSAADDDGGGDNDDSYDLLVGSALVYSPSHSALVDALKHFLQRKKGSRALVLQILDRPGFRDAFLPRCEALGLAVKIETVSEEVVRLAEESMGKRLSDSTAFGLCTISM